MKDHRLEVAEIFRRYGEKFLSQWGHTLSPQQRKALRNISVCRTAALGAHLEQCDACGHQHPAYDSCRDRHCPKCQSTSRDRWLAKQAQALLPVPYCHVVFTVPGELAPLARQNQRLFYTLLFRAVAQTLLHHCCGSAAPRSPYRLSRRVTHLEPEFTVPSPSALPGARRRHRP